MADKAKKSGGRKIGSRIRKNPLKTKDKVPYLVDVVPTGTANLDTILSEVAESLNITKARARLCFDAMFELIHEELAKGNKVQTPFGLMEPAISGSFDAEDAPFDPKRNKVYVKVTPPKAIRDALKKVVPERLDVPSAPLEIAAVVTSSLGKKGYNTVRVGEAFAVSGQGFSETVQVTLVDKKDFAAGQTVTLGEINQSGCVNYTVAVTEQKQPEPLEGDINADGICDKTDLVMMRDYLLTTGTLTAEQSAIADMNKDGKINGIDLTLLMHILLK